MNKNKYLIKQAQDAYNDGNYETSILLYQKAIEQYPELAKFLQFNLDFINQKKCNLIKNLPSVTTIIVAYNHEKYIAQCLESVIKQNYPKHNIIISDDKSTDRTREIINNFSNKYSNIIDISSNKNLGLSKNFQKCIINKTTSKYVAICEGDDYWTDTNKLNKMVEFMEKNSDCSMCFSKLKILYENKKKQTTLKKQEKINKIKLSGKDFIEDIEQNLIVNFSCCLFSGNILRNMPKIIFGEPNNNFHRFNEIAVAFYFERFGKIGFINEILSIYRVHNKGVFSGEKTLLNRLRQKIGVREIALQVMDDKYKNQFQKIIDNLKYELNNYG